MPTYQTRNHLARTNPLRSMPMFRPAPAARTPAFYAGWELDRAADVIPSLERQFAYARECLGRANQMPKVSRRHHQAQAMRFLNRARAALRAGHKRMVAAQAAVAALRVQPMLAFAA